ncbi:MAG: hypothetical protein O3A00_03045 [Planctomycetota bacterium]|nr:hypothetical protein [Planctomycetota bacterium]
MNNSDVDFRRSGPSRFVGFLTYLLIAPTLTVALSLIWMLAVHGLGAAMGWDENVAMGVGLGGLPFVAFGSRWLTWREYRQRASAGIRIGADRIDSNLSGATFSVIFDEIDQVAITGVRRHRRFQISTKSGRRVCLPPIGFPVFDDVVPVLQQRLIPRMVRQIEEQLYSGESLTFRVTWSHRVRLAVLACTLCVTSFGDARAWWSRFRLGRQHGLRVTAAGLTRLCDERSVGWAEASLLRIDETGITLHDAVGFEFSLPSSQQNYWPLTAYALQRLRSRENPIR